MRHHGREPLGRAALLPAALLAAAPAFPHHSWSTDYDMRRSRQIYGTVSRVLFRSPHSQLVVAVESADGQRELWIVEWGSPHRLRERDIDRYTIQPGDRVLISGNPHRRESARSLRLESLLRSSDGLQID